MHTHDRRPVGQHAARGTGRVDVRLTSGRGCGCQLAHLINHFSTSRRSTGVVSGKSAPKSVGIAASTAIRDRVTKSAVA